MRVGVIGLGYVGRNLAQAAAKVGHQVVGVDTNPDVVASFSKDDSGILASVDYSSLKDVEIVVIAVPTPLDEKRAPDLSFVEHASAQIALHVGKGALVVNESTSYPGTLRNLIAPKVGAGYLFAAAPERIDPGNTKWGESNTPRLVSGLDEQATKLAVEFYSSFCSDVRVTTSPEVAEAAKLFENTFRQVNIALVNEFAQVADSLGISTFEVLEAAASKPFGFMKFLPSVGVGGHCIPIDPSYLSYAAEKVGLETRFIDVANQVNLEMPKYVAKKLERELGGLAGKKIQVAGIAYKADVLDTRESPALALIAELRALGADVSWHDPLVKSWNGESSSDLASCDAGVIVTAHSAIDFGPWRSGAQQVFDVSTSTHLEWPKFL